MTKYYRISYINFTFCIWNNLIKYTNIMETKFTKGEWIINRLGISSDLDGLVGDIICEAPIDFKESYEKWEANAKLISAAPDLLKACIKAMDECCDLIATDAGIAIENAIKKATE